MQGFRDKSGTQPWREALSASDLRGDNFMGLAGWVVNGWDL